MVKNNIIVGIDATRSKSGGAKAHLNNIISNFDYKKFKFKKLILWAHDDLIDFLPERNWLIKRKVRSTKSNLLFQIFWQKFILKKLAQKEGVDIMFNTDSSSFCDFSPSVTLNQDLLAFDDNSFSKYSMISFKRLRLLIIKYVQINRLKKSDLSIFQTNYSANYIQKYTGKLCYRVVNHAVDKSFYNLNKLGNLNSKKNIFLYIADAEPYKNHLNLIKAFNNLREKKKIDIELRLIGITKNSYYFKKILNLIKKNFLNYEYIKIKKNLDEKQIKKELQNSNYFIFPSECETFSITLLEAMASGIPILCSNKSSLPEVIQDGTLYFDPDNIDQIIACVEKIINDKELQKKISDKATKRAKNFDWKSSADNTWMCIQEAYKNSHQNIK